MLPKQITPPAAVLSFVLTESSPVKLTTELSRDIQSINCNQEEALQCFSLYDTWKQSAPNMIFQFYFCGIITVKGEELYCLKTTCQLIHEQRKEPLRIPHALQPISRPCTDAKCSTEKLSYQSEKILFVSMNLQLFCVSNFTPIKRLPVNLGITVLVSH